MRVRLALVSLILVLPLTACSNDNDEDTDRDRSKSNREKIKGFNNCISGGLGSNAVEIKNKIDKCSGDNLE